MFFESDKQRATIQALAVLNEGVITDARHDTAVNLRAVFCFSRHADDYCICVGCCFCLCIPNLLSGHLWCWDRPMSESNMVSLRALIAALQAIQRFFDKRHGAYPNNKKILQELELQAVRAVLNEAISHGGCYPFCDEHHPFTSSISKLLRGFDSQERVSEVTIRLAGGGESQPPSFDEPSLEGLYDTELFNLTVDVVGDAVRKLGYSQSSYSQARQMFIQDLRALAPTVFDGMAAAESEIPWKKVYEIHTYLREQRDRNTACCSPCYRNPYDVDLSPIRLDIDSAIAKLDYLINLNQRWKRAVNSDYLTCDAFTLDVRSKSCARAIETLHSGRGKPPAYATGDVDDEHKRLVAGK